MSVYKLSDTIVSTRRSSDRNLKTAVAATENILYTTAQARARMCVCNNRLYCDVT